MPSIRDARGREIDFPQPPKRVVSLIPSITESLFDLGLGDRVAGVSKYCIFPEAETGKKPKIGGQKNPDFDAIAALDPDLVIVNEEENKPEHIEYFIERYRTYVTYPRKFVDAATLLDEIGVLFGVTSQTKKMAETIREVASNVSNKKRPVKTLYLIWRNPWMSINRDTFIDDLLGLFGLQNVFSDRPERYFEVSAEEIAAAKPELILLPNEPYHFLEKHKSEFVTLDIPAVANRNIRTVDGTYFCWYGTRSARAGEYIKTVVGSN